MEAPVYQELSWNTVAQQPCKQKDYRMLEQRRNSLIQSLQQSPSNRVDLEKQLHSVQTEMYMYQNSQKQEEFTSYRTPHVSADPPPMESDLMDMLGMPQSGATWNKQFDSGFASGSTTSPPSDDGGNNDYQAGIDEELAMHNIPPFDWDAPYNKSSYTANQSRSERLRAELFPDANEENFQPPPQTSPVTPVTTSLQPMEEPTPHPAMENIAHYQDDAELALLALPELTKLLATKSPEVLVSVTTCIHQISKKEATARAMLGYPQLITSILHLLTSPTEPEVTRCCVATLYNISNIREGLEALQKFRGIPILCDLLTNPSETVMFFAITTLHNLIQRHRPSHMDICLSGGLEKLVSVLKYTDKTQFAAMVAECIHFLCFQCADKKQSVAASSGPLHLVKLLQTSNSEFLTWSTARALKTLSSCTRNKSSIIEAGGMQALARHLDMASHRVTEEVLYAMRNLSYAWSGAKVDTMDLILTRIMDILARSTNMHLVACSAGCLSNLTCNNPGNKKTVFRAGGLDTLLRCLSQHHAMPSVSEPLLCTLRHIIYKHSEYEQTQHAFRTSGGINLLAKLLPAAQHWAVIKAACGLMRNLTIIPANLASFKDTGILLHLIQACLRVTDHSKGMTEIRDGIRLEDILWESLKTLETVSSHGDIRVQLNNPSTAHLLMKSVNSNNENLVQAGLSIIVNFESYDNFMLLIRNDPRFELIEKLCHYLNPKIAQLASALLARLNQLSVEKAGPGGESAMFGVQWGESVPQMRSEAGATPSHLSDVVDLDATTAQYRNDSFIKSPGSAPVVPTPSAGAALHAQYSPRYHATSPHVQQHHQQQHSPYNTATIPFPTNYSNTPQYQTACHPFSTFQPGYTPPSQNNRTWYAAM